VTVIVTHAGGIPTDKASREKSWIRRNMLRTRIVFAVMQSPKERHVRKTLIIAGTLLLATPATSALAHDSDYYQDFFNHSLDHSEHQRFHQQFNAEHRDAHEEGFSNPQEHQEWHRAYGATHGEFHQEHPRTWHDHPGYGYYGYYPYGYNGYYPYGWYGR
jgi:hypothetical protein